MKPATLFIRFLAGGLMAIFLSLALAPIAPMASFVAQQSYIAEVFCVNKANPEFKCNGKCYLVKQLKQTSAVNKSEAPPIKHRISGMIPVFLETNNVRIPAPEGEVIQHIEKNSTYQGNCLNSLFRPPRQA